MQKSFRLLFPTWASIAFLASLSGQAAAQGGLEIPDRFSSGSEPVQTLAPSGGSVGQRALPPFLYDIKSLSSDLTPYISDAALDEDEYLVGPGDLFQLYFESSSVEKQVSPEGTIILNRIGEISLRGLNLRQAKQRILERLQLTYKKGSCFVSLSRPKLMRIFVTGAVNVPGIYDVPGNFRLSDALRVAGGFSSQAQKGDIRLITPAGERTVNVRNFFVSGDLSANPYITQGGIVQVPFLDPSKSTVQVRRGGMTFTMQLGPGETASDLLVKSYSFSPPEPYVALIVREGGRDSILSPADAMAYRPAAGALIEVVPASRQEIFVAGAVAAPGPQPHLSDWKVIQYVSKAGLMTNSKIPRRIQVIRSHGSRETISLHSNALNPGDVVIVGQNAEQKFLIYTPILLSFVSLSLAVMSVTGWGL